jgi:hypothetical protein
MDKTVIHLIRWLLGGEIPQPEERGSRRDPDSDQSVRPDGNQVLRAFRGEFTAFLNRKGDGGRNMESLLPEMKTPMFRRHRRPADGTPAVPWQDAQPVFRQEKKEREELRRGEGPRSWKKKQNDILFLLSVYM